jgi:hypothetical protein
VRVLPDLALVDHAALVPVEELDRVLDGHDVVAPGPVREVDQRRQRRGLSGTGRAGHQHHAARQIGERAHRLRDAEVLEGLDLVRDPPEGGTDVLPLPVDIDAEPGGARHRVREVELELLLEALALLLRQDGVDESLDEVRRQRRAVVQRRQLTVDPHQRRGTRRQVQVRRAGVEHALQQLVERDVVGPGVRLRRRAGIGARRRQLLLENDALLGHGGAGGVLVGAGRRLPGGRTAGVLRGLAVRLAVRLAVGLAVGLTLLRVHLPVRLPRGLGVALAVHLGGVVVALLLVRLLVRRGLVGRSVVRRGLVRRGLVARGRVRGLVPQPRIFRLRVGRLPGTLAVGQAGGLAGVRLPRLPRRVDVLSPLIARVGRSPALVLASAGHSAPPSAARRRGVRAQRRIR